MAPRKLSNKKALAVVSETTIKPPTLGLTFETPNDGTRSLADAVADVLVNAVAQGLLQPGQRLVEADIAGQLKISRVPVREAFKILQTQGILKAVPNHGARVAPFNTEDFDQVTEVRLALERIAARHAAETYRREPRRLDLLRENISRMERASHWSDWAELRKLDVAFHHEFCKASENEIVLSLWEALARRINIIFGKEIASERNFQVVVSQHKKLIRLFETGDPDIESEIESHILRLHSNRFADSQ